MIRLKQAVIVEGKYDKITLQNVIDATIITTNGFAIFKDKEKCDFIRKISKKHGIILMTDSDSAGALIRSHLKKICQDGEIINVYIPQLKGREKRKRTPSKEGLLGVEGMSANVIIEALKRSGVEDFCISPKKETITKTDLFVLGLSGGVNSSAKREELSSFLQIPKGISSNAFLDAVNSLYSREDFLTEVKKWQQDMDKS